MPIFLKNNTPPHTWVRNKLYLKLNNNTWKRVPQVYIKTQSGWKPVFSYRWDIGAWTACSASCGTGTQTRQVVCRNEFNEQVEDSICTSMVSPKPAVSQICNGANCTLSWNVHWDDDLIVWYKSRHTQQYVQIYSHRGSNSYHQWGYGFNAFDWPLRIRIQIGNSGGHGCGSTGFYVTIPGVGTVAPVNPNWGNYSGCWDFAWFMLHANGHVDRLGCKFGAARCGNAGFPYTPGMSEPAW